MGSFSIFHWIVLALIFVLLFGRGRISDVMGDVAKGIKSFKKGLAEDDAPPPHVVQPPRAIGAGGDTVAPQTERSDARQ